MRLLLGVAGVLLQALVASAAPSITSLTPNTGAVGCSIVITGSSFGTSQSKASVTFDGKPASISSFSSTSITATVPTGATTGNVVVTVSGSASNGVLFTVTPAPNIGSLTPNTGAVGSKIIIAGTNFGPTQGNGNVKFNGVAAVITSWSATQIVAAVPKAPTTTPTTTENVVVTTAGGVSSNTVVFTLTPAPSIGSLVPNSGAVGTSVTINGANFGPSQGDGKVTFNGTNANVSSWSASKITATVPVGATTGKVVVITAGGVEADGVAFTVISGPSITSISPTPGIIGSSETITGSNFGATQGTTGTVSFNGVPAAVSTWSNASLVVTVPAGATSGNVVVTVSGQASNGVSFTVLPHINAVSPASQPVGKSVTISGTGFGTTQGASTVTFGGVSAVVRSWSSTQISTSVPAGVAVGSEPVVVNVPGAGLSNAAAFTVVAALTVTASASPAANANGWNNSSVAITYQCSGGVLLVQCPPSQTVSAAGANQTISATATDANGNTASASVTLNIDKTAPTITAVVTPTANAQGVVTALATVNFSCSDALSGIAACPPPIQVTTAGLNQSFSGTATDRAGNTAGASVTVSVQSAALAISATASSAANVNGWNNTTVTVSYTCSGGVPPLQCPAAQTVSAEGANQVISASVPDAAMQTASTSVTLNIDKTLPIITAAVIPAANAQGVLTVPATINFTCSDVLSGVALCPSAIQVTTPGANQSFSGTATDKAGNTASTSVTLNVEQVLLSVVPRPSPVPNANNWNNMDVTISYTCAGGVTPLQCPAAQTVSSEGAGQIINVTATDASGQTAMASVTLNVDKTAPSVSVTQTPASNPSGWNNSDVTVAFACSDATSGVAVCPALTLVTTEGAQQQISGQATDTAGNTVTASKSVNVDKTNPIISVVASPAPNAAGWNNSDVTIATSCADSLSGVASCSRPVTISTEGQGLVITSTATDMAGNNATTSTSINLDKTPPAVNILSPAVGAVVSSSVLSINGSASDSVSGIASVTCNDVSANFSVSSFTCNQSLLPGANTILVQVKDVAGNLSSSTRIVIFAHPISITTPTNLSLFSQSPVNVAGTVGDPAAQVTVNGILAPVSGISFLATVPLQEGTDTITAVALNTDGTTSTASVQVVMDTTPPHVAIYSPSDQFVTTDANITVTGLVNDIVVGTVNPQQATISVNGIQAQVSNRSFSAANVPLAVGQNFIRATAVDRAGNSAITEIVVIRQAGGQPLLKIFSGNGQSGSIKTALPQPMVAQLLDATGQPVIDAPVVFKVKSQDGTLSVSSGSRLSSVVVTTDSQGLATATYTLGTHSGAGNNLIEASATGVQSTALFSASATSTGAVLIVPDSGNNQTGAIGNALPLPFVAVVTDSGNNRLANVPVTFNVVRGNGFFGGQSSYTVNSDGDGRVEAVLTLGPGDGINNNAVTATFPGNPGSPVTFTATGRTPGPAAATSISGVVVDNSNQLIPGVTMRLFQLNQGPSGNLQQPVGTPVQTDGQGQFLIQPAPVGVFKLMADGGTATRGGPWPTLEYDIITVSGQNNTVGSPIYLPQLNPANQVCVSETSGGTLTIAQAPGFSLTIAPGSATFPGGSRTGCVSVTPVNMDKVPMSPGFGQQPRFVVTIQPVGTMFNPPAAITLPNVDGLAPRAVTEMYSYDHDLAAFVSIGNATVSDDGSVIKSDAGVGVLKAGWHCGGDPNKTGGSASLTVSFDNPKKVIGVDPESPTDGSLAANAGPTQDGTYIWEIVATQPTDDTGAFQLTSQPACDDQGTCVANFSGVKAGAATLRVHFKCKTTKKEVTADARITVVKMEFQKQDGTALGDVIRMGQSTTTLNGTPHDRTQQLQVKVTPASEAANVTLRGTVVTVTQRQTTDNIVNFDAVGGGQVSIDPGDAAITASDGTVTATQKASVVRPAKLQQTFADGPVQGFNAGLNLGTSPALCDVGINDVSLVTEYEQKLKITVLDNLNQPIGDLYKGAEVTESGSPCGLGDAQTNLILGEDSTYIDPVGFPTTPGPVVPKDSDQANAWKTQPLKPLTAKQDFQNFTVKIDGIQLDPNLQRKVVATPPTTITVAPL